MTSFVRRWSPHFMSQMLQRKDQSGIHTYTMTHDTYHGYESLRHPMATGCWLMTPIAWCLNWPYSGEAAKRRTTSRGVEGWKQAQRRCSAACGSWIHLWETLTSLWKIRRKNTFRWNSTFESYVRIWIRWRFCWGELNISIGWIFLIVGWCVSF